MNEETRQRIGDYEILDTLGAGGMGKVFRVRNVFSDRIEAMKILLPSLTDHREMAERFIREIKLVASLHHPNIANLCTAQMLENHLVMVMEFVEGDTFSDLLDHRAVPLEHALGYFDQALAALGYAHNRGIVHRDIKPSNIMLTPDGVVKLMDFGIARSSTDRALTQTGATIGTVSYMSPEQIAGKLTDARSDLYSLGILFYETITSEQPFKGTSDYELMAAHIHQPPRPPVERVPGIPSELNDIILKLLAKEPEKRFQSAEETRTALRNVTGFAETKRGVPIRPLKRMPTVVEVARESSVPSRREATIVERPQPLGTGPGRMPTILEPQFAATLVRDSYTDRRMTEIANQSMLAVPAPAPLAVRKRALALHPVIYGTAGLVLVACAVAVPLLHSRSNGKSDEDKATSRPIAAAAGLGEGSAPHDASSAHGSRAGAGASGAGGGAGGLPPGAAGSGAGSAGRMPGVTGRPAAMPGHMTPAGAGAAASANRNQPGTNISLALAGRAAAPAAAVPPANTPPAVSAEIKAKLDSEETQIDQLDSRSVSINNSLNTMKHSMEAQGVNMRGDIATKQASMNLNLSKAKQSLAAHDADHVERFVAQAQTDAGELERFLGR